jgi:superfamily II DNA or RNA helicase
MDALCAQCNLIKGGKLIMLPDEKENQFLKALEERSYQRSFYLAASTILVHGKKKFMLLVTPGGGKSAATYLGQMGIPPSVADAFCWVAPRVNLRDAGERIPQFLSDLCNQFGWSKPEYRAADNVPDPRRGARGYITTIQSICADPGMHIAEFRRSRYALILDELQFLMDEGRWQQTLQPLVDLAEVIIVMSGTMFRGDHQPVALVPYTNGKEVLDTKHPDWITIEYTRADAIREGAILPLEFVRHDVSGQYIDSKGNTRDFAQFGDGLGTTRAEARKDMRDQVRVAVKGDAANMIITDAMDRWTTARRDHPDCQCIVVVESQSSARKHAALIRKRYPGIAVGLAISDEAKDAQDAIKEYCAGRLDVLVTVGMAYVGMDAVRASHMALCCIIRSRPYIEQAVARLVRPWGKQQRGVVVTFHDPLMLDVTKRIEEEQAEAVWKPSPGPGGGGGGPGDEPMHIRTQTTDVHSHELSRVQLTPEMTKFFTATAAKYGISLTPIQMHDFINDALGIDSTPMQGGRPAPIIGRSEMEKRFRDTIETKARAFDYQQGWELGATNKAIWKRFKKDRIRMSVEELAQVLQWLNAFIAANGGEEAA